MKFERKTNENEMKIQRKMEGKRMNKSMHNERKMNEIYMTSKEERKES